eukprot:2356353-Rhodomonas_salina.1
MNYPHLEFKFHAMGILSGWPRPPGRPAPHWHCQSLSGSLRGEPPSRRRSPDHLLRPGLSPGAHPMTPSRIPRGHGRQEHRNKQPDRPCQAGITVTP